MGRPPDRGDVALAIVDHPELIGPGGGPAPAPAVTPALELLDVAKRYGTATALHGVSLSVMPGEFFTLLGPSGSGKTTTLMLLAGFLQPTEGRVRIAGRDVQGTPPHKRDLGMVFQHYALFPHMNVAANIAFPLEMRRRPRPEIRRRVGELLDLMHMEGMEDRLPRQLSGGQQQRVALARALAASPPAVLMDEPLGALDRKLREELQVEFRRLHRETAATFIYVTHDQGEALGLSDRIAVMREGRLEQVGVPEALYEHPVSRFVAGFLGEANFFEGVARTATEIVDAGGRVWRVAEKATPGTSVVIAVRPENIRLGGEANAVAGVLIDRTYSGAVVRLRLDVAGLGELVAAAPSAQAEGVTPGQQLTMSWPPSAGRVVQP